MFPHFGKARARELAECLEAAVKAAGAASVTSSVAGGSFGGPFAVLGVLIQLAKARCDRIANDPPRTNFDRPTIFRVPPVWPAAIPEDPYRLTDLAFAFRELTGSLSGVVTAFEKALGASEAGRSDFYDQRRREAIEYGHRASDDLRFAASHLPDVPWPPEPSTARLRSEDLPDDVRAYLFQSNVRPSQVDRLLTPYQESRGVYRERLARVAPAAVALAEFFESWDGEPTSNKVNYPR